MINIASRATRGINISNRQQTRNQIITLFKAQMNKLKEQLKVSICTIVSPSALNILFQSKYVTGSISLTCDAWQAPNTDGYFAVTSHWIEESSPGMWMLEHALFGFMWMNTAHNGKRLGQALFKITNHLGVVHKVNHYNLSFLHSLLA
jgi:hypothetical protein